MGGIHCRPSAMLIQERATYEGDVMVHSESGVQLYNLLWSVLCLVWSRELVSESR